MQRGLPPFDAHPHKDPEELKPPPGAPFGTPLDGEAAILEPASGMDQILRHRVQGSRSTSPSRTPRELEGLDEAVQRGHRPAPGQVQLV